MRGDLAFLLGDFLLVCSACLCDLPTPLSLLLPVIFLGPRELAFCSIDSRFVSLLAAEHSPQPPLGLGLEVLPLRSPKGDPELAKVQRRHRSVAPERSQADPGVPGKR